MSAVLVDAASNIRRIAVAGNPNSGKTTLFNALTGLRQKVANYPGVTVEKREGTLRGYGDVTLLDLPGAYSLSVQSPDERIPRDVLLGRMADTPRPDGVTIVVDASNLGRNLYFATQIIELGLPSLIALNMTDRAASGGTPVDAAALARGLGVPVVSTVGHQTRGVDELAQAIAAMDRARPPQRHWRLPPAVEGVVQRMADSLADQGVAPRDACDGLALLLLTDHRGAASQDGEDVWPAAVEGLRASAITELSRLGIDDVSELIVDARYTVINDLVDRVAPRGVAAGRAAALSDRIDRIVTHRIGGWIVFVAIMVAMFLAIFLWAEPLMGAIETGQGWLQGVVRAALPEGALRDLLADGLIGGVGSVVVFLPQICLLFLFIALLEQSGYMARGAFLMHKLMTRVGLHGKSFIPLLSSFACAIPGIMSTRMIENRRDRFTTILISPLMSCSARLPVYLTIIAVVFGGNVWLQTAVICSMYLLGVVAALLIARLLKRTLLKGPPPTFIMELPPYQLPQAGAVLRTMWERSSQFLTGAGTTIVAICIVLWALAYFPRDADGARLAAAQHSAAMAEASMEDADTLAVRLAEIENERIGRQLRQSYLGRIGHAIEPAVEPLGFDWKIGVGVLASFAAREVFVGTMGMLFSVGESQDDGGQLRSRMRADVWSDGPRIGRPIYTVPTGVAIMVFYVLCCQCASTIAVVRRETQSWRWPAFMFAYMTVLAYAGALLVYQAGTRLSG